MLKHMLNTSLIVAIIYICLLFVIKHPFAMALLNDEQQVQQSHDVAKEIVEKTVASDVKNKAEEKPLVANNKPLEKKLEKTKIVKKPQVKQATTLAGIQRKIQLNSPESIAQTWQAFQNNKILQGNVQWQKAPIKVYAYYANFSPDFTSADLTIAYDKNILMLSSNMFSLTLPKKPKKEYVFNMNMVTPSNETWAAAYQHKNLLEVYELDIHGNTLSKQAFIFQ